MDEELTYVSLFGVFIGPKHKNRCIFKRANKQEFDHISSTGNLKGHWQISFCYVYVIDIDIEIRFPLHSCLHVSQFMCNDRFFKHE